MFFKKDGAATVDPQTVDIESFEQGITELLVQLGIQEESRTHSAIRKMLVDDVLWYLDNSRPGDLEV